MSFRHVQQQISNVGVLVISETKKGRNRNPENPRSISDNRRQLPSLDAHFVTNVEHFTAAAAGCLRNVNEPVNAFISELLGMQNITTESVCMFPIESHKDVL